MLKTLLVLLVLTATQTATGRSIAPKDMPDIFKVRGPSSTDSADWGTPIDPVNFSYGPTAEPAKQVGQPARWWVLTAQPSSYLSFGFGDRCNRRGGFRICY